MQRENTVAVAEAVRDELLRAMQQAYEESGQSGLCAEGRWELAVDRARSLDLYRVLQEKSVLAANEHE